MHDVNPLLNGNLQMGTLENNEDPDDITHRTAFHQRCTVFLNKIDLQWKKYNIILQIITCDPSIYTLDHPDLTVSNIMENSIYKQRVINVNLSITSASDHLADSSYHL